MSTPISRGRRLTTTLLSFALLAACGTDHPRQRSVDAALAAAVRVEATGCASESVGAGSFGAGSFVAPQQVLTVAHVVAGATAVRVVLADGSRADATVVAIDRRKDLAVLELEDEAVPLARNSMRRGSRGSFVGYRNDRPIAMLFVTIDAVQIDVPDLDHDGSTQRLGYELRADVNRGDSGSVLVTDGAATGIVFARSTATDDKAWALDITEAEQLLATAGHDSVDVGECILPAGIAAAR